MARIFLSHSSKDKRFANRLAHDLRALGHDVWFDAWTIGVGQSIVKRISEGLDETDYVVVVLSPAAVESPWVEKEWMSKFLDEIKERRVLVLTALLKECKVPRLLADKRYAEFSKSYAFGLAQLAVALAPTPGSSGIVEYVPDFVNIATAWHDLFSSSRRVDLLMMYSRTWFNTYLPELRLLLARRGGRLRVILPDTKSRPLMQMYAKRLEVPSTEIRRRVHDAITNFRAVGTRSRAKVELFALGTYMNHACYLFDAGGILAMYSFRTARVPTPAFRLVDGPLLSYVRSDFEALVAPVGHTLVRRIHES